MAQYQISMLDDAEHDLAQPDKPIAQRVVKRIEQLVQHFDEIKPDRPSFVCTRAV